MERKKSTHSCLHPNKHLSSSHWVPGTILEAGEFEESSFGVECRCGMDPGQTATWSSETNTWIRGQHCAGVQRKREELHSEASSREAPCQPSPPTSSAAATKPLDFTNARWKMVRPTHPGGQAAWRIQRMPVKACVHSEETLQVGLRCPQRGARPRQDRHRLRGKGHGWGLASWAEPGAVAGKKA